MFVNLFKCLTIPFCLIMFVYGDLTPSITYITQTQTQDVGRTLDLVCAVEHAQEYPVLWTLTPGTQVWRGHRMVKEYLIRNHSYTASFLNELTNVYTPMVKYDKMDATKSIILSNNYTVITGDLRISLRFDPAPTAYILSIKDLEESDAGWYQCQIIRAGKSNITADVELQIRTRAVITDNSTRILIASEGESVQLECYATGVPTPTVYWRREEDLILHTGAAIYKGNILKFPSIQKEDQGAYYCVAENHVFEEDHRLIEVHVRYAPFIVIPEPQVQPTPGQSTYLTCHIGGYPPPIVTWIKDEAPVKNDQHYRIANFAVADDFISSFVRMDEVFEALYGNYTCKAQNELGTAEGHVEIIEPIIPECVPPCDNDTHIETTTAWRPWITTK